MLVKQPMPTWNGEGTHTITNPVAWKGATKHPVRWVQTKYNGQRMTVYRDMHGNVYAHTRGRREDINLARYMRYNAWWKYLVDKLPPYSSIDGELYVPRMPSSEVTSAIKGFSMDLRYVAFTVYWWRGTFLDRATMADMHSICTCILRLQFAEYTVYANETEDALKEMASAQRIEGYVLKQNTYCDWYKVKPVKTIEAIVTGIKQGRGKYEGKAGALLVSVMANNRMCEVASVSGMSDAERNEISNCDIGRVVEVAFQDFTPDMRLQHPRFVRWRDDKFARDCTLAAVKDVCGIKQ